MLNYETRYLSVTSYRDQSKVDQGFRWSPETVNLLKDNEQKFLRTRIWQQIFGQNPQITVNTGKSKNGGYIKL